MRGVLIFAFCLICSASFSQSASIDFDDAMSFTSEKVTLINKVKPKRQTSSASVSVNTSHARSAKQAIDIYPNPSYDKLMLETDGFNFNHIFVSTMTGRIKLEQRIDASSWANIDVSHLKKGTYLITVRSGQKQKEQYFTVN